MLTAVTIATQGYLGTLPEHLRQVGVAVSGGKDSTATVALMVRILGAHNVKAITMPKDGFTSKETRQDAVAVCKALGVDLLTWPVNETVSAISTPVNVVPGSDQFKTAQAMSRMVQLAVWCARDNLFFTSNTNMTELAFGYGTLNADLRGVFAPWGNCLAQDVYRILDHLNRTVF